MAEAPRQVLRVAPGRTVYHGPVGTPFRAGDRIDLPPAHAAALAEAGHVVSESETPAVVAADEQESNQ